MKQKKSEMKESVSYILELFKRFGGLEYGEKVSQSSHAMQAGLLARAAGADDEMILAAFLHDIGHLVPLAEPTIPQATMGEYGMEAHDKIGEDFLSAIGCGNRLLAAVRGHVAAKRYLCFAEANYFDRLSEASKATLLYQGGPMKAAEARDFEQQAFFREAIALRRWDDDAKVQDFAISAALWEDMSARLSAYLLT